MRELSLREGDVVKIYSRIGGDQGWWKGETNGRVSNLPGLKVLCRGPGLAFLRGQGGMNAFGSQSDSDKLFCSFNYAQPSLGTLGLRSPWQG